MTTQLLSGHFVRFFDADDHLVAAAGEFLREGLELGCTCVALATPPHRERINAYLAALGFDPAALESRYQYIPLDARTMLANFVRDRRLDQHRFHETIGLLMRQAAARGQPVRIFGEMVGMLASETSLEAALELEELWNELSRQQAFLLLCGYPRSALGDDVLGAKRKHICAMHSGVLGAEMM